MHLFHIHYLLYLILNIAACFFLMVSVLGIPGNPDQNNSRQQRILDLWGKLLTVAFRGIPMVATAALIAFYFHLEYTGRILSWINFVTGMSMLILVVAYWRGVK